MKKLLLCFLSAALFCGLSGCSEKESHHSGEKEKGPKLVVGIVVDQMRYDFLYRYWDKYGNGGFKRLLKKGYLCADTHIDYTPTYTGPGHSCIYTGATPAMSGIVANEWYDRPNRKSLYCVEDRSVKPVGSANDKEGKMSPKNLLSSTITDELRMSDNFKSKVIGVSLKDRGAILPAGHRPTGAYWYDGKAGNWITSTWYMDSLPAWVNTFNAKREPVKLLNQDWLPMLGDVNKYTESTKDNTPYEEPFTNEVVPVFPYHLWKASGNDYDMLRETPFGNTYTKDFAEAAIEGENLGRNGCTDFLAVSFSSTDYVGHRFGPNSVEIEDTYLRLDKDIEDFLDFLDSKLGKNNVLVFLTADHGVVNNPEFLKSNDVRQSGGFFKSKYISDSLNDYLKSVYHHDGLIEDYRNQEIYFDHDSLAKYQVQLSDITAKTIDKLMTYPGVANVISAEQLRTQSFSEGQFRMVQRGFQPARSGDIAIVLQPGWIESNKKTGTTHGSGYDYDTHIPLVFYGWHVKHGVTELPVSMTDIAPTLAAMLQIQPPSGNMGKPIAGLVK